jgi:hypothetical protein
MNLKHIFLKLRLFFLILGLLFIEMPQNCAATNHNEQINSQLNSYSQKKQGKKQRNKNQALFSDRNTGLVSAIIGAYAIIFSLLFGILFFGAPAFIYLITLMSIAMICGIYLLISGIKLIDSSYIYFSENPALKIERLKSQMILEFIIAGLLLLISIALLFIKFFASFGFCIFGFALILTLATLKHARIKNLKKETDSSK